jgi:hypothetical protein
LLQALESELGTARGQAAARALDLQAAVDAAAAAHQRADSSQRQVEGLEARVRALTLDNATTAARAYDLAAQAQQSRRELSDVGQLLDRCAHTHAPPPDTVTSVFLVVQCPPCHRNPVHGVPTATPVIATRTPPPLLLTTTSRYITVSSHRHIHLPC